MTLHFLASQNTQEVMFLSQSVCQAMLVDFTDVVLASEDTYFVDLIFCGLIFQVLHLSCNPSVVHLWLHCGSESTIYPCEDKSFCPSKDKYQRVSVGMGMRLTKMRWGDEDHLKIFVKNTILALACPTFRCSLPKVIYIFRSGIWDPPFWSRNPEGHNSQPEKQSEVTTSPPLRNNASPHQSARWSSTKHICTAWFHLYLSKLPNIFVHIPKCICPHTKMCLSTYKNVFVHIPKCICPHTKCISRNSNAMSPARLSVRGEATN